MIRRSEHSLPGVAGLEGYRFEASSASALRRRFLTSTMSRNGTDGRSAASKAEPLRGFAVTLLAKEPDRLSLEILRRENGWIRGGKSKSGLYELIHSIRPKPVRLMTRFEGLPGEFSQHDFGQMDLRLLDEEVLFVQLREWLVEVNTRPGGPANPMKGARA